MSTSGAMAEKPRAMQVGDDRKQAAPAHDEESDPGRVLGPRGAEGRGHRQRGFRRCLGRHARSPREDALRTSRRLDSRIATISSICSAVDDQRRAEGDPVRVEAAEQAVLQGPAADRTPKAASAGTAPSSPGRATNSIAWNSPLPRMSPMTPYFVGQLARSRPRSRSPCVAGVAAEVALEDLAQHGDARRRTRSGCPRRCAPRRSPGSRRSAPRRRRRSAGGRSSPRSARSRRSAPWRCRARRASRRTSRPRTSARCGRSR